MSQIRLTGHIDVPPQRRGIIAAALPDHIRLTRAEPGCVSFAVTPDEGVAGRWLVAEVFESREAFETHQARAAASGWGKTSAGIERSYRIEEIKP